MYVLPLQQDAVMNTSLFSFLSTFFLLDLDLRTRLKLKVYYTVQSPTHTLHPSNYSTNSEHSCAFERTQSISYKHSYSVKYGRST